MTKEKKSLDLDKLIKKAQAAYGKKENGLAQQLTTGSSIVRPSKDSDYILWQGGPHWKAVTGLPGIPFGKIVQVSGKPDSGKSSHAALFMKYALDQGVLVILWDSEKKFSAKRFVKMGGDPDKLLVVDTNNIINGAKAVAHFIHAAKEMDPEQKIFVVWDSVGASVNSTEDNEENEDYSTQPGVSAKQSSFAIRKFNRLQTQYFSKETGEESIATLIINQTYSSIGKGPSIQIEKGGSELYYLSSLVLQLSRKADIFKTKNGDKFKVGIQTRCRVKKNHLFDGDECVAELDLVISSDGIHLHRDIKNAADLESISDTDDSDD